MLVLSRKFGESVVVTVPPSKAATEIVLTFVGLRNGGGRIGFVAPEHVEINRMEVQEAVERERRRA